MDEPVIFREGGCLDSGCLPISLLIPAIAVEFTARAIRAAILAVRRTMRGARDRRRAAAGRPPAPTTSTSTATGPPVRPASQWAEAQRALRTAYLRDPSSLPRRRVTVTIDGSVTVSDTSDPSPSMTFTPSKEPGMPSWVGAEDGTLVGELGTNAAACVEVAGGVVWPAYNPVGRATPGRARPPAAPA